MQRKQTLLFGIVLTLVTLSNFVPGTQVQRNGTEYLFGIFEVGTGILVLHLVCGLALIAYGLLANSTRGILLTTGAVFGLTALIGWVQGNTVLGLMNVNVWDNALHTFFMVFLFTLAVALKESVQVPATARS